MDRPTLHNTHVKLLAFDLLNLAHKPHDPHTFTLNNLPISRVEILGIVTSHDHKPNKFLKFTLDDGTGLVTCVLWLNHMTSPYFSRRSPQDVRLIADVATCQAREVKLGVTARVRGRVVSFRGGLQVTVTDVVVEKDPNVETLHWLQCVRLGRQCYDVTARCK